MSSEAGLAFRPDCSAKPSRPQAERAERVRRARLSAALVLAFRDVTSTQADVYHALRNVAVCAGLAGEDWTRVEREMHSASDRCATTTAREPWGA